MSQRDDDDWVGTPPEGRHSRDRADPDFWNRQWQVRAIAAGVLLVLLVILALAIL
ncbi:MAG: hypothetical protein ACXW08_09735 [Solirubrobacteraceae bacterium]